MFVTTDLFPYPSVNIPGRADLVRQKEKAPNRKELYHFDKASEKNVQQAVNVSNTICNFDVPEHQHILVTHDDNLNVNVAPEISVDDMNTYIQHDHNYLYKCNCHENCSCTGCIQKQKLIKQQASETKTLIVS